MSIKLLKSMINLESNTVQDHTEVFLPTVQRRMPFVGKSVGKFVRKILFLKRQKLVQNCTKRRRKRQKSTVYTGFSAISSKYRAFLDPDANGNRTRVTTVKGWCLDRLTMAPHIYPS